MLQKRELRKMTTTPSSGGRSRQKRWSFRVSPTQPWGRSLLHGVPTTDLLAFPMAFTQDSLLSPDDFVKRASERGASFRVEQDRNSTRLNSSHLGISYAVFCLKKK